MTDQSPPRPRKGCLFYGCLILVALFLAMVAGLSIGGYFVYKKAEAFVDQYAAMEPVELSQLQYTEEQTDDFKERMRVFIDGLGEGMSTAPLVLQGEDLNMLLASSSNLKTWADGVRLSVEGNEVKGQISLRLGDLGAPFFKDRYFNGTASFKVSIEEGELIVSPSSISVNGNVLPDQYMAEMREQNLAVGISQDPDLAPTLEQLESIEVKDGTVTVFPMSDE